MEHTMNKQTSIQAHFTRGGTPVRIIITGGTFDKRYDPLQGELGFSDTHLPEIIQSSRCSIPVTLEILQLKDSLYMTDDDRNSVLQACIHAPEQHIIITHGTDTMTDTAKLLGANITEKYIVLTGAMVPYSIIGSDAVFNLGASMTAVQQCSPGVHICMNGRVFSHTSVRKNHQLGIFEETT